jgi:hypothetical protein
MADGEERLRLTSEKGGKEMPGGVHGKNDPMEDLINKYLGEEDEDEEGELGEEHEHDDLKK